MNASPGRIPHRRARRGVLWFASLWSGIFTGLVMAGAAELQILRLAGVEHRPLSALQRVLLNEFSVSADGRCAISRVRIVRESLKTCEHHLLIHHLPQNEIRQLRLPGLTPCCVATAPRGDLFALAAADGSLYTASAADGSAALRLVHRTSEREPITEMLFSPDGRLLVAKARRAILLINTPRGDVRGRIAEEDAALLAISGDGRRLLSCDPYLLLSGRRHTLRLWSTTDGAAIAAVPIAQAGVRGAALSGDGAAATLLIGDGTLRQWDFAAGREVWRRPLANPLGYAAAFSPDGRLLAISGNLPGLDPIHVYEAATCRHVIRFDGHEKRIAGLAFASDGRLYSWDALGEVRAWRIDEPGDHWRWSLSEWCAQTAPRRRLP